MISEFRIGGVTTSATRGSTGHSAVHFANLRSCTRVPNPSGPIYRLSPIAHRPSPVASGLSPPASGLPFIPSTGFRLVVLTPSVMGNAGWDTTNWRRGASGIWYLSASAARRPPGNLDLPRRRRTRVTSGLERTFGLLRETANEAAVPVLIAALELPDPCHPGRCVSDHVGTPPRREPADVDRALASSERAVEAADRAAPGLGVACGAIVDIQYRCGGVLPTVAMRCCTSASSI